MTLPDQGQSASAAEIQPAKSGAKKAEDKGVSEAVSATFWASAILVLLVVFMIYLLTRLGVDERTWIRTTFVYSGLEAIGFAAAGYFFGREVHREQAKKAEEREEEAVQKAERKQAKVEETVQEKLIAETGFLDLYTIIGKKHQHREEAPQVAEEIRRLLGPLGVAQPDLMRDVELSTRRMGAAVPDSDWEELRTMADAIARRMELQRQRGPA
jgi:hypothetical protein